MFRGIMKWECVFSPGLPRMGEFAPFLQLLPQHPCFPWKGWPLGGMEKGVGGWTLTSG